MGKIKIKNETTPATPASGTTTIYVDSADKHAKTVDDTGTVTDLTSGTDADAIHDNVAGEIDAVTEKGTPVSADLILIEDSADSNNKKKVQIGNLPAGSGTDNDAIHDNVAGEIAAITEKGTPVSADLLIIEDSADSNNKKKVQIGNLPGGSSDPSSWLDRSSATEDRFFVNTTNDFVTEASALSVNHNHTPNATGTYLIQLSYGWTVDTGTFDFDGELLVDDGATATTVRRKHKQEPQDAGGVDPDDGSGTGINGASGTDQRQTAFLEYFHSATSGTAFNVRFQHACLGSNGVEATVKWSVLKIERWS